jgi:diacylglycerol kinase family enzyme
VPRPVVQLFVNPTAGSASSARLAALRAALETAEADVIVTQTGAGSLTVHEQATHVCSVGGDGTLRHVAAAVRRASQPIRLSLYPAGTVNLLARECGYRMTPTAFAKRLLGSQVRLQHHALIDTIPFFTCASIGPDSLAVAALSPRLKRWIGRAAYGVAFLGVLVRWPRQALRLRAEGPTVDCEAVYIAKGRYYAGPWSFAPEAAADVPLLHVVALRRARRRDFLRFLWSLMRRTDLGHDPNLVRFSCTALSIDGDDLSPLQADGDIVARLPVRIVLDPTPLPFA